MDDKIPMDSRASLPENIDRYTVGHGGSGYAFW